MTFRTVVWACSLQAQWVATGIVTMAKLKKRTTFSTGTGTKCLRKHSQTKKEYFLNPYFWLFKWLSTGKVLQKGCIIFITQGFQNSALKGSIFWKEARQEAHRSLFNLVHSKLSIVCLEVLGIQTLCSSILCIIPFPPPKVVGNYTPVEILKTLVLFKAAQP